MYKHLSYALLCVSSLVVLGSCTDDNSTTFDSSSLGIQMKGTPFRTAEDKPSTRTLLTPSSSGTNFEWSAGDVAAVYSSEKGLTNFFIDEHTISDDKLSATFYGSGFSLSPTMPYWAFYPYNGNELDKKQIHISYQGQDIKTNGSFRDLGNFDYMAATSTTDEHGHASFEFSHLGCVVEYRVCVPQTATYTKVRLETGENTLTKCGVIDLDDENQHITPIADTDSILTVHLNGNEGIHLSQDSILTIYMMMAPQDLSREKLTIRLVDSSEKWYSAIVQGRNMKAGYTYHYSIAKNGAGGFEGTGTGLPNDEALEYEFLSATPVEKNFSFEDYFITDQNFYAAGANGIRTYDISNPLNPAKTKEIKTDLYCKSIRQIGSYFYAPLRSRLGGNNEAATPEIRLTFESNIHSFGVPSGGVLSDNAIVNSFFEELRIVSAKTSDIGMAFLFKAYNQNNVWRNSIKLRHSDGSYTVVYNEEFATEALALQSAATRNTYSNAQGDYCKVNWGALPKGYNCIRVNFNLPELGSFDHYETNGQAQITETGSGCPNLGGYAACLTTAELSQGIGRAVLTKNIPSGTSTAFVSLWINVKEAISSTVTLPLLSTVDNNQYCITLTPIAGGYRLGIKNDSREACFNRDYTVGEWYNIKLKVTNIEATLWSREKEAGNWTLCGNVTTSQTSAFKALHVGFETASKNASVLLDDIYYNSSDLDEVSYINGAFVVMAENLDKVVEYHLDLKPTHIRAFDHYLILSCLKGFNIYDLSQATSPKLVYTYRYLDGWMEYQGLDVFERDGHRYVMFCNYCDGMSIFDITDIAHVNKVCQQNFSSLLFGTQDMSQKGYNFDVVVDYPYAYTTYCVRDEYLKTEYDHRGILVYDLSNLQQVKTKLIEIPNESKHTNYTDGDVTPTRMAKAGNYLFVNNGNKGAAVFDVSTLASPTFVTNITPEGCGSITALSVKNDLLLLGDRTTTYIYRLFNIGR